MFLYARCGNVHKLHIGIGQLPVPHIWVRLAFGMFIDECKSAYFDSVPINPM